MILLFTLAKKAFFLYAYRYLKILLFSFTHTPFVVGFIKNKPIGRLSHLLFPKIMKPKEYHNRFLKVLDLCPLKTGESISYVNSNSQPPVITYLLALCPVSPGNIYVSMPWRVSEKQWEFVSVELCESQSSAEVSLALT